MAASPKLGKFYTRQQINEMHGGGVQSFLPMKNARVVCGCFLLSTNPDAPTEILVGVGPRRESSAITAVLQLTPFPVFIKKDEGEWEYIGYYRATRYLERTHHLVANDPRVVPEDVAGIMTMVPQDPEA